MGTINISICLSDLPKEKIKQARNGKKYINLCLSGRREPGKYGETHVLYVSRTSEEQQSGEPTIFVGSGKEHVPRPVTPGDIDNMPASSYNDDLPF